MLDELTLAKDPTTSAKILIQLVKSERLEVIRAVAANPNTPLKVLMELGSDRNFLVRAAVAL